MASATSGLFKGALDPRLTARVIQRRELLYSEGADPKADRPAYVRAGSGVAWVGKKLAILQDDANFVALVDPLGDGRVDALALPRGVGGKRVFDTERGNKKHKLDLEACLSTVVDGEVLFFALGSGSTRARENILEVNFSPQRADQLRLHHAPDMYESLREKTDLSGSELNIEGVVMRPEGVLRLFQRGNGAPRGDLKPVNATCDVSWSILWEHLHSGGPPPSIQNVIQYELGQIGGTKLTFTDALCREDGQTLFLATAEDSPDAVRDGEVFGTAIGRLDNKASPRWAPLCEASGDPLRVKAEGIVLSQTSQKRAYVVLDSDTARAPAELLDIELKGPWWNE